MYYDTESQAKFLAKHLGPLMRERHPELKLMIHDDQTVALVTSAGKMLDDPEVAKYVDGVAYHWYFTLQGTYENSVVGAPFKPIDQHTLGGGSDVNIIWRKLQEQSPDKFMLMSEACNGYESSTAWFGPRPGDWGYGYSYSHDILWQLRNGASGWTDWNLALDSRGGPNVAGNLVDSPIVVQDEHTFIQNPSFFHMAHFSRYVLPGSRQVKMDVKCGSRHSEFCQSVAFLTPENNAVVVITNDEITVGAVAGNSIQRDIVVPYLGRGQGSLPFFRKTLTWTIRCGGKSVSGEIAWKAIQTVVFACGASDSSNIFA